MKQRVVTSIIGILVFVPILFFSNAIIFRICLAIISAVSAFELLQCVGATKKVILSLPLIAFAFSMPMLVGFSSGVRYTVVICAMIYCLLTLVLSNGRVSVSEAGASFMAITFCSVGFACTALLRETHSFAFFLVYLGAWGSDTFAYLVGRACGKIPLIPKISPKKTVEGAIGGAVAGIAIFLVFGLLVERVTDYRVSYIILSVLGLLSAVISQLGDLIMSAIKRSYGVKDFGRIFPGHGGMLDRFDSTITVAPMLCMAFNLFEILYK